MPISQRYVGQGRRTPGTYAHLGRFAGGPVGDRAAFLAPYAWAEAATNFANDPHFVGDTLETNFWTTNAGSGGTAFAVPATPGAGGTIAGATGTDGTESNRCVNLYGAPVWMGDLNPWMEVRLKASAVTDIEFACGFIDTHDTITTAVPLFGDIDTPTLATGIGDAAIVGLDTAQTLTTLALACLGSGALNAADKTAIGTYAPTAATYFTIRIQIITNDVIVTVDDGKAGRVQVSNTTAIEGGTLLRPIIAISGPTATSRTYTIDRWHIGQDEAA